MIFNLGVSSGGGSSEDVYKCNGVDDNVQLSTIAREWLEGGNDYLVKTIKVQGTIGITGPIIGTGAYNDRYAFFDFGKNINSNRRIIFDFAECSELSPVMDIPNGLYVLFAGKRIYIKYMTARMVSENTFNIIFEPDSSSYVECESCRFYVMGSSLSCIARTGTFINCVGESASTDSTGMCFQVITESLIRVTGGEYYAYTRQTPSDNKSAVMYFSGTAGGVGIMDNVSCPSLLRSGFKQTDCILQNGGYLLATAIITILPSTVSETNGKLIISMRSSKSLMK